MYICIYLAGIEFVKLYIYLASIEFMKLFIWREIISTYIEGGRDREKERVCVQGLRRGIELRFQQFSSTVTSLQHISSVVSPEIELSRK